MNIQKYLHSKPIEELVAEIQINVDEHTQAAWEGWAEITIFTRNYGSTKILTSIGTRENPSFEHSEENLKRAALNQYLLKS